MSERLIGQITVDDLVERCDALGRDINQRLENVEGADGIDEVERLQEATNKIVATVARKVETLNERPSPEVGDEVFVDLRLFANERSTEEKSKGSGYKGSILRSGPAVVENIDSEGFYKIRVQEFTLTVSRRLLPRLLSRIQGDLEN